MGPPYRDFAGGYRIAAYRDFEEPYVIFRAPLHWVVIAIARISRSAMEAYLSAQPSWCVRRPTASSGMTPGGGRRGYHLFGRRRGSQAARCLIFAPVGVLTSSQLEFERVYRQGSVYRGKLFSARLDRLGL